MSGFARVIVNFLTPKYDIIRTALILASFYDHHEILKFLYPNHGIDIIALILC